MSISKRAGLRGVLIVFGCWYCPTGWVQTLDRSKDAAELQRAFAQSSNYKLITNVADIPPLGQRILSLVARHGRLAWNAKTSLADIGAEWSTDDSRIETLPWGQHRFSAVSNQFIAIVFVVGGGNARHQLVLARPGADWFCWFNLPDPGATNLRLSVVRNHINPDRDQTVSKSPTCEPNPVAPATFHLSE